MAVTHSELLSQYGGWDRIPSSELYRLIDENRDKLTALHQADVEKLKLSEEAGKKPFKKTEFKIPNMEIGKEVRRRCEQDLEWLGAYMCWETNPEGAGKPITENLMCRANHGPIIDFFIKKDKSKPLRDQDTIKNRLLLYPRGGLKTSWDILDAVQWILNFPEIRILFLTAADDLAVGILDEFKSNFVIREFEPTLMNMFFPEFCVEDKHVGNQFEFICPVWADKQQRRREPTVMASSITSTLAGFHFELIKADDTVSNRNSENEEQCLKVTKNFAVNKKMLRAFGYCDKIGTRYHDEDMYGHDLVKNVGEVKTESGPGWELMVNETTSTKILIGRAITIKPEVVEDFHRLNTGATYADAGEAGCILLMPAVLPYSFLVAEYAKDDAVFEGQMNQNPRPPSAVVFDRPLLLKSTVSFHDMPKGYTPRAQFWDFAFSEKYGRDYSVGVGGCWDEKGTMYVEAMKRDRYGTPLKLAQAVVEFAKAWRPFVVGIENAGSCYFLHDTIMREAAKHNDVELTNLLRRIEWVPVDTKKGAKKTRMMALQPLLEVGSLKFAFHLEHLKTLYDEFERCLTSSRHDDIPDAIAMLARYMPRVNAILGDPDKRQMFLTGESRERYIEQAQRNLLYEEDTDEFGRPGRYVAPVTALETEDDGRDYNQDLDNILGAGLIG